MNLFGNMYLTPTGAKQLTATSRHKYGVSIGDIGVEFDFIKDREKMLLILAKSNAVKINSVSGEEFTREKNSFGLYERDTTQKGVRCYTCNTVFYGEECRRIEYESPCSYSSKGFSEQTNYICDKCHDKYKEEVAEIKKNNLAEKEKLGVE